jgi:biopolymer transport protein ExbD
MIALVALLMAPSVIYLDVRQPSADLPFVNYSTAQRGALREDALVITVERDGSVYLLRDRIMREDLPGKIRELRNSRLRSKGFTCSSMLVLATAISREFSTASTKQE